MNYTTERTRRQIIQSFIHVLQTKRFSSITIQDKEYPHMSPKEAIVQASRHIGSVIIAAVIILGGTFATLMPAGMVLLSELAIAVITGLIVLCFVLLPIFLPAMVALPGTLVNLFSRKKEEDINFEEKAI
ncbi:MMPL family transporter [Neobacillus sp. OS1-32]|uniref:MMPL family transporter n=1 Tax=Neobacillus sp. OS1-32 TaxID=3070682 RepID=UPI0027DF7053|nr:MMPL family transporter [Neobacillus sp. OS1-32]WML28662.1 MMPL family transporter [Neobacillus sp. OS1-32]